MELATARAAMLEIELQKQHLPLLVKTWSNNNNAETALWPLDSACTCVVYVQGAEQHKATSVLQSLIETWLHPQSLVKLQGCGCVHVQRMSK